MYKFALLVLLALFGVFGGGALPASAQQAPACPAGQTAEFCASGNLTQINAANAYQLGFTGKGVNIGVVDIGFDPNNLDLTGKIRGGILITDPQGGYSALSLTAQQSQGVHGTAVSDIALAALNGAGVQGVAYDSGLFVAVPNENGNLSLVTAGTNWMIANGLKIINYSIGYNSCQIGQTSAQAGTPCNVADYTSDSVTATSSSVIAATRAGVGAGALLIFAAGNSGQPNPDVLGGLPYLVSGLSSGWLVVGAVDVNNVITDYSNRCGVAASFCLVAPGNLMAPVGANGALIPQQGTSFAAPGVAGAAALVAQAYPWFTNTDIQQTLLTTATPLGTRVGNLLTQDTTYGWGLLNVGAAVQGYGGFVNTSATLDTQGNNSTFANNIYGNAGFTKVGAGTLTLSGASTYSGATNVNGGALAITGSILSPTVMIGSGGALGGSGVIGAAGSPSSVTVNGTLGLGAAQTLTINGNLTFTSSANYLVAVQGPSATQVKVSGAATLAGALSLNPNGAGSYMFNSPYVLLTAQGGLRGAFNKTLLTTFGPGVTDTVAYTSTAVNLTLSTAQLSALVTQPSVTPSLAPAANVGGVAAALDRAKGAGDNLSPLFPIYNSAANQLDDNLKSLDGEVHASVNAMAVQVGDGFINRMLSPILAGRAGAESQVLGYAPSLIEADAAAATRKALHPAQAYTMWAAADASYGRLGANGANGSSAVTLRDGEVAGGVDFHVSPDMVFGLAGSIGSAGSAVDNSRGVASFAVYQIGGYGVGRFNGLRISDAAAFSWLSASTTRVNAALGSSLTASYGVNAISNRFEAAYTVVKMGGVELSPFGSIYVSGVNAPGFTESGANGGGGALVVSGRSNVNSISDLGIELAGAVTLGGVRFSGYNQLSWERVWAQSSSFSASLSGLPGSNFTTLGASLPRNSFKMSSETDVALTQNMSLTSRFDTRLAGPSRAYGVTAGLRIAF